MTNYLLNRRNLLALAAAGLIDTSAFAADDDIGAAADVRGHVVARRRTTVRDLSAGAALRLRDTVESDAESFAKLELAGRTVVHMGSNAKLKIDKFVAEAGGILRLGDGAIVFDRAEELPKLDISVRTKFGRIAVRGTRFFCGPSKGVFGVFVERGAIEVSAAGVTRQLGAGQGVDIAAPGQPPSEVKSWGAPRIAAAFKSVGL